MRCDVFNRRLYGVVSSEVLRRAVCSREVLAEVFVLQTSWRL